MSWAASHEAVGNVKRDCVVEVGYTLLGVLYPFEPMGELMPNGCNLSLFLMRFVDSSRIVKSELQVMTVVLPLI